ncbi:hypothetical protein KPL70_001261 [Citrus sinensis]|nr:hypothetical protein KPL70_001261 [Citrus sinensis]
MTCLMFKSLSDSIQDSEVLYLSERPEKPIVTHISVPPIAIRPSVIMDCSQSRTQCSSPKSQIFLQLNFGQADWEAIQAEVAQYVNSDVRGVPFSLQVARPLSGFVEYTGTTVISPDPNLRVT